MTMMVTIASIVITTTEITEKLWRLWSALWCHNRRDDNYYIDGNYSHHDDAAQAIRLQLQIPTIASLEPLALGYATSSYPIASIGNASISITRAPILTFDLRTSGSPTISEQWGSLGRPLPTILLGGLGSTLHHRPPDRMHPELGWPQMSLPRHFLGDLHHVSKLLGPLELQEG